MTNDENRALDMFCALSRETDLSTLALVKLSSEVNVYWETNLDLVALYDSLSPVEQWERRVTHVLSVGVS